MKICLKKGENTIIAIFYPNIPDIINAVKMTNYYGTVANPISIDSFLDKGAAQPIPLLENTEALTIEVLPTNNPPLYNTKLLFLELKNIDQEFNAHYGTSPNLWDNIIIIENNMEVVPNASLFIEPNADPNQIKFTVKQTNSSNTFIGYSLVFSMNLIIGINQTQTFVFVLDPLIKIVSNPADPSFKK